MRVSDLRKGEADQLRQGEQQRNAQIRQIPQHALQLRRNPELMHDRTGRDQAQRHEGMRVEQRKPAGQHAKIVAVSGFLLKGQTVEQIQAGQQN